MESTSLLTSRNTLVISALTASESDEFLAAAFRHSEKRVAKTLTWEERIDVILQKKYITVQIKYKQEHDDCGHSEQNGKPVKTLWNQPTSSQDFLCSYDTGYPKTDYFLFEWRTLWHAYMYWKTKYIWRIYYTPLNVLWLCPALWWQTMKLYFIFCIYFYTDLHTRMHWRFCVSLMIFMFLPNK